MKVLVGVDESEYSGAAIRFISETVWPKTSQFIVLSTSSPIFLGAGEALPPDSFTEMLKKEEERHGQIANRAATRLRKGGLSAEARTARGSAQTVLVDTARSENADLVIVGSHGRTGFGKLFLGSVASHVVTHSPCSVLVVKQHQLHDRALQGSGRESGKERTMKIEQLMTRDVETCTPETDLARAAMIMSRRNCGLVPVVARGSGRLAGVITDRDICMAAAMRHVDAHSIPVGEVMTSRVVTCAPTDDARVAMHRMSEAHVRRLPVVDREGKLKGVVSLTDLALVAKPVHSEERAVQDMEVLAVLKAVSDYPLPVNPVSMA
jgi:CBS domain-containing protein/nucleotide-binding universal stress UspA family protein